MMTVDWVRSQDDTWCHLDRVNLECVDTGGVFIIWHGGHSPRVVRVGQSGDIAKRLTMLKEDSETLAYKEYGELYVTWASVPPAKRDGVVCFLVENWKPHIAKACPMVFPITVNSPID